MRQVEFKDRVGPFKIQSELVYKRKRVSHVDEFPVGSIPKKHSLKCGNWIVYLEVPYKTNTVPVCYPLGLNGSLSTGCYQLYDFIPAGTHLLSTLERYHQICDANESVLQSLRRMFPSHHTFADDSYVVINDQLKPFALQVSRCIDPKDIDLSGTDDPEFANLVKELGGNSPTADVETHMKAIVSALSVISNCKHALSIIEEVRKLNAVTRSTTDKVDDA